MNSSSTATVKVLDTSNTKLNNNVLTLRFTDAPSTISAGTPFIIKSNTNDNIQIPTSPIPISINGSDAAKANMTLESSDGNVKFVGRWSSFTIDSSDLDNILFLGTNNTIGFSKSARTLQCFRAHFWANNGSSVRTINLDYGDGETTSIALVANDASTVERGCYTLDGRKLNAEPTQSGLYIFNGRKVIIK